MSKLKFCDYFLCTEIDNKHHYSIKDNNKFLKDWLGIDNPKSLNISGIYMFGNFYIGKSTNIRKRILQHIRDCINSRHCNYNFDEKIYKHLKFGKKITIEVLSTNTADEIYFIKKYSNKHLTNIEYNKNI